jgi:hypothetical protein
MLNCIQGDRKMNEQSTITAKEFFEGVLLAKPPVDDTCRTCEYWGEPPYFEAEFAHCESRDVFMSTVGLGIDAYPYFGCRFHRPKEATE